MWQYYFFLKLGTIPGDLSSDKFKFVLVKGEFSWKYYKKVCCIVIM